MSKPKIICHIDTSESISQEDFDAIEQDIKNLMQCEVIGGDLQHDIQDDTQHNSRK